jgi:DNA-binding beta-propeller fold protein YncE
MGNAWVTASNNDLYELQSESGSSVSHPAGSIVNTLTGNGLNLPTGIAIDPSGVIWIVNSGSGANSVSAFTGTGGTLTGSPFTGAGITSPAGVAINGSAKANCADCN